MAEGTIEIVRGIPQGLEREATAIYYAAFRQKLTPFLGADEALALERLQTQLNVSQAFVAIKEDKVLGLVGFHHEGQLLVDIGAGSLFSAFGPIGGLWRIALGILVSRTPAKGEFLLDGIAVHADARGQGVGTRLFEIAFAFAREHGYTHVRLEVVNSNPRAQQLYERLGFVAVKTENVPFLKRMGFTAVTTMRYDL